MNPYKISLLGFLTGVSTLFSLVYRDMRYEEKLATRAEARYEKVQIVKNNLFADRTWTFPGSGDLILEDATADAGSQILNQVLYEDSDGHQGLQLQGTADWKEDVVFRIDEDPPITLLTLDGTGTLKVSGDLDVNKVLVADGDGGWKELGD